MAVLTLAAVNWFSDSVTLKGHWTLYTARCAGGTWQGKRCTGRLVAAERHRFVADKVKAEVVFKVVDPSSGTSSGKLSECAIEDGRDWVCLTATSGTRPATQRLARGEPVGAVELSGDARLVPKWKWICLRLGVPVGSEVEV